MQVFGVPLHSPRRKDLPRLIVTLVLAIAGAGCVMFLSDSGPALPAGILVGGSVGAIGTACWVDPLTQGFKGLLVMGLILLSLVATMLVLEWLFS
jgi:hypothetical protein